MTFERPLRWLFESTKDPKAAFPKLRWFPTHTTSTGPNRRVSPEELADLAAVSLEGDVPHQNLGGGLLSGNLFLPSGGQGWPAGWGKGAGQSGRQPLLSYTDSTAPHPNARLLFR